MRHIGIDPGKLGALAYIGPSSRVLELVPTPLKTRGKKRDFDLEEIHALLLAWQVDAALAGGLFAVVELLHNMGPRFRGSSAANFARGVSHGWSWMLTAMGIPFVTTLPQTWQKVLYQGITGQGKGRSLIAARNLWPDQDLRRTSRSRLPDDGFADALLLAEYGRRLKEAQARRGVPLMPPGHEVGNVMGNFGDVITRVSEPPLVER